MTMPVDKGCASKWDGITMHEMCAAPAGVARTETNVAFTKLPFAPISHRYDSDWKQTSKHVPNQSLPYFAP